MATMLDDTPRAGAGWGWLLASGIVALVLGVSALIWPFPATRAVSFIVGAFFIAIGALALAAGIGGRGHGRRNYLILYGALSLLLGLLCAFWPVSAALTITVFIAAWLFVRGVLEVATGLRITDHCGLMLGLGVLNIVLAALILVAPLISALILPGYILGVSFLFGGMAETSAALHHRRGAPAFAVV